MSINHVIKKKNSIFTNFQTGDNLKIHINIIEGNRSRVQIFNGFVLKCKGNKRKSTFTIRKISFGIGVERTFSIRCPNIKKIELISRGKVRRSKLYYMRSKQGKSAKIRKKIISKNH